MNNKQVTFSVTSLVIAACFSSGSRAQSLDLTLLNADVSVTQGTTTIMFDATIFNPSATATVYLNGDSFTTSSLFLTVDDSPFNANAPISLAPGQSSRTIELFDAVLSSSIPVGTYGGSNSFSILGGTDGGTSSAFSELADAKFSVTVNSPTVVAAPEIDSASAISAVALLLGGLAVMRGDREKTKGYRGRDLAAGKTCGLARSTLTSRRN